MVECRSEVIFDLVALFRSDVVSYQVYSPHLVGGRNRGARGSFYPRGGLDAQARRQAPVEATS